jgi:hypothetical protein
MLLEGYFEDLDNCPTLKRHAPPSRSRKRNAEETSNLFPNHANFLKSENKFLVTSFSMLIETCTSLWLVESWSLKYLRVYISHPQHALCFSALFRLRLREL